MTYELQDRGTGWSVLQNGRICISGTTDVETMRAEVERLNRECIGIDFAPDQRHRNRMPIDWSWVRFIIGFGLIILCFWIGVFAVVRFLVHVAGWAK